MSRWSPERVNQIEKVAVTLKKAQYAFPCQRMCQIIFNALDMHFREMDRTVPEDWFYIGDDDLIDSLEWYMTNYGRPE